MRIPVFARRANPSADRPIVKKSESYADAQVAAGLADYVDPKDKRKGIIAREYLASSRVAAAEPGDLPNCFRADGELPDDPLLHACVATYASDMNLFDVILAPHEVNWDDPEFMGASLDHCMWFHRPFRFDDFLLHEQESPVVANSRGLTTGHFLTRAGAPVASAAQQVGILTREGR